MPIVVVCSRCGSKFSAPDHAAGTRGKCSKCGTPIQVPAAGAPANGGHSASVAGAAAKPRAAAAGAARPAAASGGYAVSQVAPPAIPVAAINDAATHSIPLPAAPVSAPMSFPNMPIPPGTKGFIRLGTTFSYCGIPYFGNAIASENAIYLTLNMIRTQNVAAAGVAGGAIGGLIAGIAGAMAQSKAKNLDRTRVIPASLLPPEVRSHPDWPAKKLKDEVDVVVIPRHAIEQPGIVHPKWGNVLKLLIDGNFVMIEYGLFQGAKVKAFLEAAGYPLAWRQNITLRNADGSDPQKKFRRKLIYIAAALVVVFGLGIGAIFFFGLNGPHEPEISLYQAAMNGDLESIRAHQKFGTNFNGSEGALFAAAKLNRTDAVAAMLEAGAKPDVPGPNGQTAAYIAAEHGNLEILKLLMQRRANFDIRDIEGYAPLHAAAWQGHTEAVRAIIEYGRDVNGTNGKTGETPLMLAADMRDPGCVQTIKFLLSHGANKELRSSHGETAFDRYRSAMRDRRSTPEDPEVSKLLKP